jgi:chaperonin GroEL
MKKELKFDKEAQDLIVKGFKIAARAVVGTIGPNGRNVFIADPMLPRITNDGVSIAGKIMLENQYEDLGAWTLRTATARANDEAGDGTTTTAVLAESLLDECLTRPENPMKVRKSLQEALPAVLRQIEKASHPTTKQDVHRIALISAEDHELASIVSEVIEKKGKDASVHVEDSPTSTSYIEFVDGYEANIKMMHPLMVTNAETQKAEYKNVHIFCTHRKIGTLGDIKPLFDKLEKAGINQLVIVCDEIEMGVLGALINSKLQGTFNSLVVRATGELLDDIAAATGATQLSETNGISFANFDITKHLGKATEVISGQKSTLFISSAKTAKQQADRLIQQSKNVESEFEKNQLRKRAAKLKGDVAKIKIGTTSEASRGYMKDKAEDAVAAVKSALEEGYVEGGGMTLYRIAEKMKGESVGEQILKRVLTAPLRAIIENGGEDYATIVKNMPEGKGYNARTGKYVDLLKEGIIDPAKVERVALESAVESVSSLITTHAALVDYVEPKV